MAKRIVFTILLLFLLSCRDSGKPVWHWALESRSYADPVFQDSSIFVVSQKGEVIHGNYKTGERIWSRKVPGEVFASPAVEENRLFIANYPGSVFCWQTDSGQEIWHKEIGEQIQAPLTATKGLLLIPTAGGTLLALSTKSGEIQWSIGGNQKYNTRVVIHDRYLLIGGWGKILYCLKRDGSIHWQFQSASMLTEDAMVSGDTVYLSTYDDYVYALELTTGRKKWEYHAKYPTNAIVMENELLFASEQEIHVLNPNTGKLLRKFQIGIPVTHVYDVSGRCFLASQKLYELDPGTGTLSSRLSLQAPVFKVAFPTGRTIVTDEVRSVFGYSSIHE